MVVLDCYANKRVFVTGHTGFKGSWLCLWLTQLGAHITAYAKPAENTPDSLYNLIGLSNQINSYEGDIRDYASLHHAMKNAKPDIIFHLAAQSLVLPSYESPIETFSTNVMGTVHVLEAARAIGRVRAIVNVTTDKCYENNETGAPFCEGDPLGGYDPYSASKAAAEIVSTAYRHSFLTQAKISMATARAGNVIGGGDFSPHRLIPDIIRATKSGSSINLRHPQSVRPWQYVLDVLHGYLMLGQVLLEQGEPYTGAYNFGPDETNINVGEITRQLTAMIPQPPIIKHDLITTPHEATHLNLNNSKAKTKLHWYPKLTTSQAIETTAAWYNHYLVQPKNITQFTYEQLESYMASIAYD